MALPNKTELEALSYSFDGTPFCQVAMESVDGLNYSFDGTPFWARNNLVSSAIKSHIGTAAASVKSHIGTASADVKKHIETT